MVAAWGWQLTFEGACVVVAGVFAAAAALLSSLLMVQHFRAYNKPEEQKWIIAIVGMVPVYAVDSWISLRWPEAALLFNLLRNCYEAYAIYAFGCYLIACMGGEERVVQKLEHNVEPVLGPHTPLLESGYMGLREPLSPILKGSSEYFYHPFPICCLEPWEMGKPFYNAVKYGLVQYMILKVLCTFATLILELCGVYGDGDFKWNRGYPYIAFVINCSQMWALYCLLEFYVAAKDWLTHIRPVPKFLCVKAVIFLTWWQGIVVAMLFNSGIVPWFRRAKDSDRAQEAVQDFLICIEMCAAAVAHVYIFPATPYQHMSSNSGPPSVSLLADCANMDAPPSPTEILESETTGIMKSVQSATNFTDSMQDALLGGSRAVFKDVQETMSQVVEPIEEFNTKIHDSLDMFGRWGPKFFGSQQGVKDDSWLPQSTLPAKVGLAPSLEDGKQAGSLSDSGASFRRQSKISYGTITPPGKANWGDRPPRSGR